MATRSVSTLAKNSSKFDRRKPRVCWDFRVRLRCGRKLSRRNRAPRCSIHQRTRRPDMVADGGYEIASLAARFTEKSNELASVRSTADTQTRWILSPPMREDLKKPGVDFRQLKERPTTVYVILPAERMRTHSVWLRLVVVSALRALYRPGGLRTLLLIDEMPVLGQSRMPLASCAATRCRSPEICQDLNQLKALYKERWESFLANAGVVQAFTPNDLTTADWMSRRAGRTTMLAPSSSESRSAEEAITAKARAGVRSRARSICRKS